MNTLKHIGYLFCLIGLWLGVRTMDGSALSLRYEPLARGAFWTGAAVLFIVLLFDLVNQWANKGKK